MSKYRGEHIKIDIDITVIVTQKTGVKHLAIFNKICYSLHRMTESMHPANIPRHEHLSSAAHNLFPGSIPVDMQFNIGRLEGMPERGLDIVDPGNVRHYVCEGSDIESETLVKKNLGGAAILRLRGIENEMYIYDVPEGSLMLAKFFRQAPYTEEYVNRQAYRTGQFIKRLRSLDKGVFGLTVQDIAVTYGTPDRRNLDDVNLTVVPPLKRMGSVPAVTDEMLAMQTAWFFKKSHLENFLQGLRSE